MGGSHSKFDINTTNRNRLSKPKTSSEIPRHNGSPQILSTSSIACLDVREPRVEAVSIRRHRETSVPKRPKDSTKSDDRPKKSFFRRSKKPHARTSYVRPVTDSSARSGRQQQSVEWGHGSSHKPMQGALLDRPCIFENQEVHTLHITPSRRHSQISYLALQHSRATTPEQIGIAQGGDSDNLRRSSQRPGTDGGVFPIRRRSFLTTPGIATRKSSLHHQQAEHRNLSENMPSKSTRPRHGRSQSEYSNQKGQASHARSRSMVNRVQEREWDGHGELPYPEHKLPELSSIPSSATRTSSALPINEEYVHVGNYRPGALRVTNATPRPIRVINDRGYKTNGNPAPYTRNGSDSSLSSAEEVTFRRRFDPATGEFVKYEVHNKPVFANAYQAPTTESPEAVIDTNHSSASGCEDVQRPDARGRKDMHEHTMGLSDFRAIGSIHHPIDQQSPSQAFEMAQDYIQRISTDPFCFDDETPRFTASPATALRDVHEDELLNERNSQQSRVSSVSPSWAREGALVLHEQKSEDAMTGPAHQFLQYNQQAARWESAPASKPMPKADSGYSSEALFHDIQSPDAPSRNALRTPLSFAKSRINTEDSSPRSHGRGSFEISVANPESSRRRDTALTLAPLTMISSSPQPDTENSTDISKRSSLPPERKKNTEPREEPYMTHARHSFDTSLQSPQPFQSVGSLGTSFGLPRATHSSMTLASSSNDTEASNAHSRHNPVLASGTQGRFNIVTSTQNIGRCDDSKMYSNTITTTTTTTTTSKTPPGPSFSRNSSLIGQETHRPSRFVEHDVSLPAQDTASEYTYEDRPLSSKSDRTGSLPPVSMATRRSRLATPRLTPESRTPYIKTSMHVLDEFARSRHEKRSQRENIDRDDQIPTSGVKTSIGTSRLREPKSTFWASPQMYARAGSNERARPWTCPEGIPRNIQQPPVHQPANSLRFQTSDIDDQQLRTHSQAPPARATVFSPDLNAVNRHSSAAVKARSYSMPRNASKEQADAQPERQLYTAKSSQPNDQDIKRYPVLPGSDKDVSDLTLKDDTQRFNPRDEAFTYQYEGNRYGGFDFGEGVNLRNGSSSRRFSGIEV